MFYLFSIYNRIGGFKRIQRNEILFFVFVGQTAHCPSCVISPAHSHNHPPNAEVYSDHSWGKTTISASVSLLCSVLVALRVLQQPERGAAVADEMLTLP